MWHKNLADGFDKPGTTVMISEKENKKKRIKLNNHSTNTWDIALCLARRASKQQDVGFESCRNYILLDYIPLLPDQLWICGKIFWCLVIHDESFYYVQYKNILFIILQILTAKLFLQFDLGFKISPVCHISGHGCVCNEHVFPRGIPFDRRHDREPDRVHGRWAGQRAFLKLRNVTVVRFVPSKTIFILQKRLNMQKLIVSQ